MADRPKNIGKLDAESVNVDESNELRRWANYWGCPQADIYAAFKAVGSGAKEIEAWLHARGKIT